MFYMPTEREYLDRDWNLDRIALVNEENQGSQNRRIEIVINYRELYNNE